MLTKEARKFVAKHRAYCHKITMSMMEHYQEHHFIDADGKKIQIPVLEAVNDETWGKSTPHIEQFHYLMNANVVQVKPDGVKAYRTVQEMVTDNIALCMMYLRKGTIEINTDRDYIRTVNKGRDILNATEDNKHFGWIVFREIIRALVLAIPRWERGDFKEESK